MDQMPVPIAAAPPSSQAMRVQPLAAVTRPARSKAAYDAKMAMNTESATSASLYEPIKFGVAMWLHPDATRNSCAALQASVLRLWIMRPPTSRLQRGDDRNTGASCGGQKTGR